MTTSTHNPHRGAGRAWPRTLATAVVIAAAVLVPIAARLAAAPGAAPAGVTFALTDQTGTPRTAADYRGYWLLVYFGFTHCQGPCPVQMAVMAQVFDDLQRTGHDFLVRGVMVSVDPARDTPERLGSWLAQVDETFVGLTGEPEHIAEVAAALRSLYAAGNASPVGNYQLPHSTAFTLVDPRGVPVQVFTSAQRADAIAGALRARI